MLQLLNDWNRVWWYVVLSVAIVFDEPEASLIVGLGIWR